MTGSRLHTEDPQFRGDPVNLTVTCGSVVQLNGYKSLCVSTCSYYAKIIRHRVKNLVALLTIRPPICAHLCYLMYGQILCYVIVSTRAVRKLSVHFEYLENRSRGLDVT